MKRLISWVEIPTKDFNRAIKFYENILQMKLDAHDYGTEKMAFFEGGEGAVIYSEDYKPSKNGVIVSLNAGNNIDNIIIAIEKNGGEIILPKTKIQAENKGYFALFLDSEGNKLGLYGDKE